VERGCWQNGYEGEGGDENIRGFLERGFLSKGEMAIRKNDSF
jgi:hypothetical protein